MRPFAASRRSSVGCSTQVATSSRRGGRCAHQIRRRSEKVVLTGADNSPDVVGPRGARTVLVVSNLGSTWNDRTVCAEQKIVPGAARHPVAATRRGRANGDGAGPGRIRSAPGDRHSIDHQSRRSHALGLTDKISIGRRLSAPNENSAQPLSHKPTSCGLHGQRSPTLWNKHSTH